LKSQTDHIKAELDEVSGDIRATWRMEQKLQHSKAKAVFDDIECAKLVSMFYQFFADKVNKNRDNISKSLSRQLFDISHSDGITDKSCLLFNL